jgi:uncharacterized protein (TIGR03437 family)
VVSLGFSSNVVSRDFASNREHVNRADGSLCFPGACLVRRRLAEVHSSQGTTVLRRPREEILLKSRFAALAAILGVSACAVSAAIISVPDGGDFQAALNSANAGDVITLAAGAVFKGPFELPPNPGNDYITIRTDAADSSLPLPGVRITPDYAGVLPKLVADWTAHLPVIRTVQGSNHYQFIGVEISPTAGTYLLQLVQLGDGSETSMSQLPRDFIFDRCYLHGDPVVGTRRGVAMNAPNVTVTNSFLADFKSVGPDSQALASWNGPGPFSITNNYLEGAGENVLIGGQDPTIADLVPTGVTIRNNHFSKPLAWREGDPAYQGTHWTVKNLLELKNAQQIVVDGNLFENNWADAQSGFAILFTPRNQDGTAPWSIVSDARFTNNIIRHVASGINILGTDDIYTSRQLHDITISNNLFDDVTTAWGGTARLFQILNGALNVVVDHNTGFPAGAILIADESPSPGLLFTNNLAGHGVYGFFGSGTAEGRATLAAYLPNSVFQGNAIIGGNAALYPSGNFFPSGMDNVGFVNSAAGDYSLLASSSLHDAATDGGDIGAKFSELDAAQSGPNPAPAIANGGAVSTTTFSGSIGSGSLVSLFGTNFSGSIASATTFPLPTTLAGTQVMANGTAVPLLYVSPTQINLQLPMGLTGDIAINVVSDAESGVNTNVKVVAEAPGILTVRGTQAVILNQDHSLNSAANPAVEGSVIQIFASGLGATNPPLTAGQAANSRPPFNVTVSPVTVLINGKIAAVQFSGAAPGFAGLFQVNATVPFLTGAGNSVPLQIQIDGKLSNIAVFAAKP